MRTQGRGVTWSGKGNPKTGLLCVGAVQEMQAFVNLANSN
jgi:hypothetical protein